MTVFTDTILDRSLGTATGKTQLSGDRSGNATNYQLPAIAKGIIGVEPYVYVGTPAANDAILASLKIESGDVAIGNYEVLAPPISGLTTVSASTITVSVMYIPPDLNRTTVVYPWMLPCNGGETFQFYGILQSAVTSTLYMGATIWWTDNPAQLTDLPYQARIQGTPGANGGVTSTGTATGNVTGTNQIQITGGTRTIRTVVAAMCGSTPAQGKAIAGYASLTAAEIQPTPIRFGLEPIASPGGSLMPSPAKLTRKDNLSVPTIGAPANITAALYLSAAPSTAGIWGLGILYN
jgi:hypothetical protein